MGKKLLIISGALMVLLVAVSLIAALTKSQGTLCDKFIANVRSNKAAKAYELYSPTVHGQLTLADWSTEVASLSSAYGDGGTLSLVDSSSTTNSSGLTTQKTYKLETKANNYILTCITLDINNEHAVDAFSSSKN